MPFAQLVIGPPGSGKTTYCFGQYQFLSLLSRPCSVINLDPANDRLPYPCAVDINRLISVRDVMAELSLGPNAAMLYCIEYLEKNVDWLIQELKRRILATLEKELGLRFVAVHLTDATHITDASRYVSILILALRAMLTLELPHVNVLSKVDLLGQSFISRSKRSLDRYGPDSDTDADDDEVMEDASADRSGNPAEMGLQSDLAFNLDFYTQVQDLSYLRDLLSQPSGPGSSLRNEKFGKLNEAICELVEDFGLVSFETLAVEDRRSMFRLLQVLDKAVGYIYVSASSNAYDYGDEENEGAYEPGRASATAGAALRGQMGADAHSLFSVADRGDPLGWGDALEVQERYIDHRELYEEAEAEERKQMHEKEWEQKVWSEVRKATEEQKQKQGK
ncbi:hypothetical protein Golomagni_06569 [Golovinomyces magnicellulatus]|nr:hypothetical protein Golomagni_06569 [Golovinomyces magnicellulatus]